ncbi:MAG: dTDP-4-dehydrorhamnose reductase [Bacteroidales bacterium]|nr:dTDP-4-dehydrorhamnose reductase [Bacteroidales bacterium]MBR3573288.1 dTDP-4-dehydrorhamnose reductase [Bacteroidales bacterium]
MNHILITGANGQLGNCLRDLAAEYQERYRFFYTDVEELDITDAAAIDRYVADNQIQIIVNAAAYTAVDKAEDDVDMAYKLNRDAVRNLAEVSKAHDCLLVHISTDYVFSGESCHPYKEDDTPAPKSVYGASKLAGEQAVAQVGCRAIIIRTSWLYSEYGHNFVKTMLRLGDERKEVSVVCDQIGGPTYAGDLAQAIFLCLTSNLEKKGIQVYHFANEGVISWYDFAKAIMEISGKSCAVFPIFTGEYPAKAPRPAYSVFNLRKTKTELGISIPYWRDSLALIINKLLNK